MDNRAVKVEEENQFWTANHNKRGYIVRVLGTSKDIEDVLRGYFYRSEIGWGEHPNYDAWRATVACTSEPVCTKCHGEMEKIIKKKCTNRECGGMTSKKWCKECYNKEIVTHVNCTQCKGTGKK